MRFLLSRPLTPPPHGTWYAYSIHTQSHRYAGAGAGANLQEVRKACHRRAADLVVGAWVLISRVPRAHLRHKEALVGAFVVVAEWRQSYRKQAVLQGRSSGRYTARGTHLHRRCDFGWARQKRKSIFVVRENHSKKKNVSTRSSTTRPFCGSYYPRSAQCHLHFSYASLH